MSIWWVFYPPLHQIWETEVSLKEQTPEERVLASHLMNVGPFQPWVAYSNHMIYQHRSELMPQLNQMTFGRQLWYLFDIAACGNCSDI